MRLSASWIVPVTLVVLVVACNTFDPDSCFPNTSGGYGGSETIPIGAAVGAGSGDFATPPAGGPLDYVGNANPCIEPQSPCDQRCESNNNAAAAECGRIADAAQRSKCQEAAYAVYKSCRANCEQAPSKSCQDMFVACQDIGGKCTTGYPGCDVHGATSCKSCLDACQSGSSYPPACKCSQCGFTQ